jgi:hypothetical protein
MAIPLLPFSVFSVNGGSVPNKLSYKLCPAYISFAQTIIENTVFNNNSIVAAGSGLFAIVA